MMGFIPTGGSMANTKLDLEKQELLEANDFGEFESDLSADRRALEEGLPYQSLVSSVLQAQTRNIISANQWTQTDACKILDLSQPKLSNLLNGKFRGISETKMLDCLTRLGRDVQIVISADRHTAKPGRVSVVAA
jgi:predicted XRE-type DNA-binding protein